jgi:hypothetical protein
MEWFMDKLQRGGCFVPNPFSGKPYRVSLAPEDTALINFWTKGPGAVAPYIEKIQSMGYLSAFFISMTGYPSWLEGAVSSVRDSGDAVRLLKDLLGKEALWWRYDPVIITEKLTAEWHLENFTSLCENVWAGNTERVIISLAHIDGPYASIRRALAAASLKNGDALRMPEYKKFIALAAAMSQQAENYGISLEVCCSPMIRPDDLSLVKQGACLSDEYLTKLDPALTGLRKKGTRKSSSVHGYASCGCAESRDIGANGTCAHGCVYCYANRHGGIIKPWSVHGTAPWLSAEPLPAAVERVSL